MQVTPLNTAPPGDSHRVQGPPPSTTSTTTTCGREGSGWWAAAILLLTHVIEITAMVVGTISQFLYSREGVPVLPGVPSSSASVNVWDALALVLQVSFAAVPFLIVTSISLVWAVRAQDFSGRVTAKLICWLLHLLQASILWRFLKIHLAFDASDVSELGTLRFVQVHVHTLPFLVVHVAILIGGTSEISAINIMVACVMVVSSVVTIVVATTASQSARPSSLTPPTITQVAHHQVHGTEHSHDAAARVVVGVTSSCILWTRVVTMGVLLCLHLTWACALVGVHWILALVWLSLQKELQGHGALGPVRKGLRRAFLAYLLLWDWHVFRDDASALTICARPRLPAVYYTITAVQNVAITAIWFAAGKSTAVVRTAIFSSLLTTQAVALLLLGLSYLYCSSLLPSWPREKRTPGPSLVTPTPNTSTPHHNNSYVDFKDLEVGAESGTVEERERVSAECQGNATPLKPLPPIAHSTPRTPVQNEPRILAIQLPATMYSYSHDILAPRHCAKSERSFTDNASFNSRNTNTVQLPPEYDVVLRTHGSFSDSFSSLSCGTIQRGGRVSDVCSVVRVPQPPHTSCRNGFCHCRLFDGVEAQCSVREGTEDIGLKNRVSQRQDKELATVITTTTTTTTTGTHNMQSATYPTPRVAVVRGVQRFRVVCAACLHAHDPLLTQCHDSKRTLESLDKRGRASRLTCGSGGLNRSFVKLGIHTDGGPEGGGSSTDYPSDTEVTAVADTLSSASAESQSTYTTWPVGKGCPGMARLLQLQPGTHDYVTAWLTHQQTRGTLEASPSTGTRHLAPRHRHIAQPRRKSPKVPHLLQDLETVV